MAGGDLHRGEAWWMQVLEVFSRGSRPLAEFCAEYGISSSQFYYQRRKVESRASRSLVVAPAFREYPGPTPARVSSGVLLRLGDVQIELAPGFDPVTLRGVLACCR